MLRGIRTNQNTHSLRIKKHDIWSSGWLEWVKYICTTTGQLCTCSQVVKTSFMQSQSESTYSEGFFFNSTMKNCIPKKSLHAGICNGSFECGAIVHRVRAYMRARCARTLNQTHRPTHMHNCTWTDRPNDRRTGTYHREIVACSVRVAAFKQIQFASAYTLITWIFCLLPFFVTRTLKLIACKLVFFFFSNRFVLVTMWTAYQPNAMDFTWL